jgi:hypothetical protein
MRVRDWIASAFALVVDAVSGVGCLPLTPLASERALIFFVIASVSEAIQK